MFFGDPKTEKLSNDCHYYLFIKMISVKNAMSKRI
jgi:hypothetical protein